MTELSELEQQLARKARRRALILLAVIVIIVIVLVGAFAYYWFTSSSPSEFSVRIEPEGPLSLTTSQSQQFNSTVIGGISAYTYQWVLNNLNVTGATSSSWTFPAHPVGTYRVYLNVTDSVGFVVQSNTVTITVHS